MDKNEIVQLDLDEEQLQQVTGSGMTKPTFGPSLPIGRSSVGPGDRPQNILLTRHNEHSERLAESGYEPLSPKPMTEAERNRQNEKIVRLAKLYRKYNPE